MKTVEMMSLPLNMLQILFVVALAITSLHGRNLGLDEEVVLSGKLFYVDADSGSPQRVSRRHLGSIDTSNTKNFRLDVNGEMFDMELSQNSVWGDNSRVFARRSEKEVEEVPVAIDNDCFIVGHLTSHEGVVSINRCDRMVGMFETGGKSYELEETSSVDNGDDDDEDAEVAELKVTVRNPAYDLETLNEEELVYLKETDEEEGDVADNTTEVDILKRVPLKVTMELGIYLDENFANYIKKNKKMTDETKITNWLILKWNSVQKVYGDVNKVGVDFKIELKYIEVWWKNVGAYAKLKDTDTLTEHLKVFCAKTSLTPDHDHKMLYTWDTGNHASGLAWVNGICDDKIKCGLSKAPTTSVRIEIHELGHNLGFLHEPQMQPCEKPGGFMGWDDTYRFQDCYRRDLLKTIKLRSRKCLFRKDVDLPIVDGSKSQSSKKKNRKKNKNKNKNKNTDKNNGNC